MNRKKTFNPAGDDNISKRTIIKDLTTGLFQLDKLRY